MSNIDHIIERSIEVKRQILESAPIKASIDSAIQLITRCFKQNGKVLFCGNGGSAADAQHLAAELSGRFYYDRDPLNSEALHVNTSYITAVSNDYSFDEIYARMIKAKGRKDDILVGISTSGNSTNVIKALQQAKSQEMLTIGFSGKTGGLMKEHCDVLINIPSSDTPRIQENHILVGHIICEMVERNMFPKH